MPLILRSLINRVTTTSGHELGPFQTKTIPDLHEADQEMKDAMLRHEVQVDVLADPERIDPWQRLAQGPLEQSITTDQRITGRDNTIGYTDKDPAPSQTATIDDRPADQKPDTETGNTLETAAGKELKDTATVGGTAASSLVDEAQAKAAKAEKADAKVETAKADSKK